MTDAPEIDAEQSDVEKLADAIRRTPGQSKGAVIEASGVPRARARNLLRRFDGQLWQSERGLNNATLYFPSDAEPVGQPPLNSETEAT